MKVKMLMSCSVRILLILSSLCLASLPSLAAKAKGPKVEPGTGLFEKVQVFQIRMRMEQSDMDQLQKSFTNDIVYVPARIEEGGKVYEKVGVHLRGVSTFQTVDKKPSWTFKFNEFVPGQQFHGLRKVRLSNAVGDKTYLQEFIASELFRSAGVATPRVNYARVELNGRDLGLYVMIEGVTKDFLKQNFGGDEGNVYEGDEADVDEHLEQDYGNRSKHQSDLRQIAIAAKEGDPVKRWAALDKVLAMDKFVSLLAMEVMMDCWDGYSMRKNNYRIFCDHASGKASFIPHGLDKTWEEVGTPLIPEMKGMVSKALLETPEGRKRYLARMRELQASVLQAERVKGRLAEVTAAIKPTLTELEEDKVQNRALLVFQRRLEKRIEFIGKQLPIEEAKLSGSAPR